MHFRLMQGPVQIKDFMVIVEQEEKVPDNNNNDLTCYLFIVKDEVSHILISDPSGILMIKTF